MNRRTGFLVSCLVAVGIASPAWADVAANLQAIAADLADDSGIGALPRVEDAAQGNVALAAGIRDTNTLEAFGYPRTPTLAHGSHTNFNLSAGATNTFHVTGVGDAYYAFIFSNYTADVYGSIAPAVGPGAAKSFTNTFSWICEAPDTYRLTLTASADTPCSLTLTGLIIPEEADFRDLNWTNAFMAAHETFSRQYAFTAWKSVDWGALYSNTLPRIATAQTATNEIEYYAALNAYAGAIPDSHIFFLTTNNAVPAAWAQQVAGGGYGLAVAELDDGRVIAAALLTNGPAQLAGMQAGAHVVDWNGLAPTSAIAQIAVAAYPLKALAGNWMLDPLDPLDPQATLAHYRLEQARLLVRGPVGTNVNVQFVNPGSHTTQTVALAAAADTNATFGLLNFAWLQDPAAAPVEYRILSNGLGYVVIRGEGGDTDDTLSAMTEAVRLFATSSVPGVVVDVRGNLGGDDSLGAALCGYFYRTNAFYERQNWYNMLDGTFTVFTIDTLSGLQWVDHLAIEPQAAYYGGPVAVLVNPGTVSSGEGIAMGIGNLPRAKVVGFHGTDGSFGMAGARIWMPGGHVISYPRGQSLDENGIVQLDSRNGVGGVAPEIRIPMNDSNVLTYAAGEDVALNTASDYLLNLPELPVGQSVTGTLAAGESAVIRAEITVPVWHGVYCSSTSLQFQVTGLSGPADLSRPGCYTLALSNPTAGDQPYTVRLYNYTNTIALATQWIEDQMASNGTVGLSVALVDGQGIAWAQGFGYADRENDIPVTTDTVFRIGSVSKMFTTTAAMQYHDQGKLGLDDSVTNYLPGLRLLDRGGFPGTEAISVRDLLNHHSGLPGNLFNSFFYHRAPRRPLRVAYQLPGGHVSHLPTPLGLQLLQHGFHPHGGGHRGCGRLRHAVHHPREKQRLRAAGHERQLLPQGQVRHHQQPGETVQRRTAHAGGIRERVWHRWHVQPSDRPGQLHPHGSRGRNRAERNTNPGGRLRGRDARAAGHQCAVRPVHRVHGRPGLGQREVAGAQLCGQPRVEERTNLRLQRKPIRAA